ncbi:MAG: hypothetical protein NT131_01240 [Methanomassiliicoccales archaeon]|nr:hypothetical protein [Methanomassiliicoccales archaeon]
MEARDLFSKWWFIALVSLAAGGLVFLLLPMVLDVPSRSIVWLYTMVGSAWAIVLTCIIMTAVPWRPLDVEGELDPVKLGQAGYKVTVGGSDFDLRVAKYSVARIRMRHGRFSYRSLPTSTGFWAVFLLSVFSYSVILAFPFMLYIYVQCQKGLGTVVSILKDLPRSPEKSVDELVMDSITSAYMLARQATDDSRSKFHDHCLILVTIALVGFVVLLMMSVQYPIDANEFAWRLGGGTVSLIAIAITGMLVLRRRARRTVEKDERWTNELMTVMRGSVPEGGSAVEMLLRACSEVPRWLNAHRKGMWNRRPAMTMLIVLILDQGVLFLIRGYGFDLIQLLGGALIVLWIILLLDQYRRGRKESDELKEDWQRKMSELESVLGLAGKR